MREVKAENQNLVYELGRLKEANRQQASKMEVMQAKIAQYEGS